jgi:hypothetical protein
MACFSSSEEFEILPGVSRLAGPLAHHVSKFDATLSGNVKTNRSITDDASRTQTRSHNLKFAAASVLTQTIVSVIPGPAQQEPGISRSVTSGFRVRAN